MSHNPNDSDLDLDTSTIQEQRQQFLRDVLPACQPQEGSPANTFTVSELQELQAALTQDPAQPKGGQPISALGPRSLEKNATSNNKVDIINGSWFEPAEAKTAENNESSPVTAEDLSAAIAASCKIDDLAATAATATQQQQYDDPKLFRHAVRQGKFQGPTNGVCPGRLQCNLVVLPAGKIAFDFLLFCQRNSKSCPLLEVCEGATTSFLSQTLAAGADLRTDIPK